MATTPVLVVDSVSALLSFRPKERNVFLKQLSSDDRPEQTLSIQSNIKSLDEFGWSEAHIALFKEVCEKEMVLQHYSYDHRYYLNDINNEVELSQ
jgi:hypothetical protein